MSNILLDTLKKQPLICAEGYLFEMERRGYLTSGEFVPEVALEHPEVLENLHKEFQHAGSNIVQAFTYNGHREKMRVINKEHLLEPLNLVEILEVYLKQPFSLSLKQIYLAVLTNLPFLLLSFFLYDHCK